MAITEMGHRADTANPERNAHRIRVICVTGLLAFVALAVAGVLGIVAFAHERDLRGDVEDNMCIVTQFTPVFPATSLTNVVVKRADYIKCGSRVEVDLQLDATVVGGVDSLQLELPTGTITYTTPNVIGSCLALNDVTSTGRVASGAANIAVCNVETPAAGANSIGMRFSYILA